MFIRVIWFRSVRFLCYAIAFAICEAQLNLVTFGQCLSALVDSPSANAEPDLFGNALDSSSEWLIVGAPLSGEHGAAHVYRFIDSQWHWHSTLLADGATEGDGFGWSVKMHDGWLAISAPFRAPNGVVFMFKLDERSQTWTLRQTIEPQSLSPELNFGYRLGLSDSALIIGAPSPSHIGAGRVFAFGWREELGSWTAEGELVIPQAGPEAGRILDLTSDFAMVGRPSAGPALVTWPGRVYVFKRNALASTWSSFQELTVDDPHGDSVLGISISMDDHVAILGGRSSGHRAGYIFRFNPIKELWIEEAKLVSSSPGDFTSPVFSALEWTAISGDRAAFSIRPPNVPLEWAFGGVASWTYDAISSQWVSNGLIGAPSGYVSGTFGCSLSIHSNKLIVGDRGGLNPPYTQGHCFEYQFGVPDCNLNEFCDFKDIANGTSPDLNGDGVPDECESFCIADIDQNGSVDSSDLQLILNRWGFCNAPCAEDIAPNGGNGIVDVDDLLSVINNWGSCSE